MDLRIRNGEEQEAGTDRASFIGEQEGPRDKPFEPPMTSGRFELGRMSSPLASEKQPMLFLKGNVVV
jgi:hypothetical protein